ncbi:MAG: S8 family serine peptidase, partial [Bacillota bacterium]
DDVNGWNFYDNNNQLYDPAASDWHGTGIAGIIAGGWNNGIGISGLVPKVKLLPVKYLGGTKGEAKTSGAIMAIEYAKKMGAKVINCSWGGPGYNAALEEVIVKSPDILFVCASGNDKLDTDRYPVYPACLNLPNTISVAAVNNTGVEAGFSNYGSKIDVAAPGNYIYSTYPGNAFVYVNGTSFAAPYVSGVAALLRSYRPDITSEELKGSIKSSVKILSSLKQVVNTSGMVDAFGALRYANNWGETPPSPIPTPVYSSTPVPTPYVPGIVGDVSGDGQVNSTDYTLMKRYLLGIISDFPVEDDLWAADVNNDSLINSTDLTLMKRFLLGIISKFPK